MSLIIHYLNGVSCARDSSVQPEPAHLYSELRQPLAKAGRLEAYSPTPPYTKTQRSFEKHWRGCAQP